MTPEAMSAPNRGSEYGRLLRASMGTEPWCVDDVSIAGDRIEIRGWAIPPGGDPAAAGFRLDGEPFAEVEYPSPRPDIERLFWYVPGARMSGFVCRAPLARIETDMLKPYVFSYVDKRTGERLNPLHDTYYYYQPGDKFAFPPPASRRRVHGAEVEPAFRLEGYTTFLKLRRILRERFQRDYDQFGAILDWGCGCGRMTRYFHWMPKARVTGIDIDAGNIAWCKSNLRFGNFMRVGLHPPTALRANHYDLLIGISIFTHLLERDTHDWLAELERIAAPGALLLMTIHSDATAARADLPEPVWRRWKQAGFADAGANADLEGEMSVQDYYRNTFFTREYVLAEWTKYFEVLEIVPGYIGNHQDLVVMRKR
jgi:2-polyprenyl-3-methyl-5-hydroxy-6-metoxy-1,4-benzoquinol methylase